MLLALQFVKITNLLEVLEDRIDRGKRDECEEVGKEDKNGEPKVRETQDWCEGERTICPYPKNPQ